MGERHEEPSTQAIHENQQATDISSSAGGDDRAGTPPRVVSVTKLEANRRNAQRSTGPRTPAGKDKSRWNAVKHGLLVKAIGMDLPGIQESKAEFQQLVTSLSDELQPVGMLEHFCIERMAVAYWRLRRVIRTEAMKLRRAHEAAKQEARWAAGAAGRDAEAACQRAVATEKTIREKIDDCDEALRLLRPIKKELNAQRDISDETSTKLREVDSLTSSVGRGTGLFFAALGLCRVVTAEDQADKEKLISAVASLRHEMKDIRAQLESELPPATAEVEAKRNVEPVKPRLTRLTPHKELPQIMAALPDALGSLPRYETMFNREIDRAMDRLMKLQEKRLKVTTPPTTSSTQLHRAG